MLLIRVAIELKGCIVILERNCFFVSVYVITLTVVRGIIILKDGRVVVDAPKVVGLWIPHSLVVASKSLSREWVQHMSPG